jgi:hypothetical protein
MSQPHNTISCPQCHYKIDVNDILHHQIKTDLQQEYNAELAKKESHYQQQHQQLLHQQAQLEQQAHQQDEILQHRLQHEKKILQQQLKQQLEHEQGVQIGALEQELATKSVQLQDYHQAKASITRLQREKDEQKATITADYAQRFTDRLKSEQTEIRAQVKQEMTTEISGQLSHLQQELAAKSEQLKELNQTKADITRLKREKAELREEVALEKEREFSEQLKLARLKIQQQVDENSALKVKELQKQLDEQKSLAIEMKRKAEQGSMQMQGEVQELAIEEWLATSFPLDRVEEIKKGARGADCLQHIHTRTKQNCGTIYYESKRTKDFQPSWIEKFKNDIREKNATLGVLVTEAMPVDMPRMGQKEGIWICSFKEFKGLSTVLRDTVIKLSEAMASQENKGDKMTLLYHYLTSHEFKLQVEGIVEGFTQMQADLESEKRSMARIWKQREKQLQKVLINTTHMYGSIKGIAGNAIASVALLELGEE